MDRFSKLKAVCCRFWAITPDEFQAKCDAGLIHFEDVIALISVVAHDPTQSFLLKWIFPEAEERRQRDDQLAKHEVQLEKLKAMSDILKPKVNKINDEEDLNES